jgi:uncharacterized protein
LRVLPACHVFTIGTDHYAYDLHTQQILAVEPELAAVLRGERGTAAARAVLRRAQAEEGLFLTRRPRLVPWQTEPGTEVDQGLQHLVLTVTEACNLRCAYCLHGADLDWVRSHGARRMSVEAALQATAYFLDRRDAARAPVISFYGGEALLNFEVVKAVVAAVREHPKGAEAIFAIDTNGVLLDNAVLDLAVQENIHLQISLDGPQPIHDRYRIEAGGQPTFARIMTNIGRALDLDPTAASRLTYVVTLAPPVDLMAVADLFAVFPPYVERGVAAQPRVTVNFANLKNQDWAPDQEEAVGLSPVAEQVENARDIYLEAFAIGERQSLSPVIRALFEPELIRFHHRFRGPIGESYTPGANCRPGRRKLHVAVDGNFHPCERTGDVMSIGTIDSGITTEKVESLYSSFHDALRGRCGDCWALRMCNICFAAQAENVGLVGYKFPVPEAACQSVRSHKEKLLKMMVRILEMPPETRSWLDQSELS